MGATGSENGHADVLGHIAHSGNGNGAMPSANGAALNGNGGGAHGSRAIIFAGGRGARLAPYTSVLPKPHDVRVAVFDLEIARSSSS